MLGCFSGGVSGKELDCQCRRHETQFNPWVGKIPKKGEGNGYPLQYSCLENSMGWEVWQTTVHRVAKNWTWLKRLSTHAWKCQPTPVFGRDLVAKQQTTWEGTWTGFPCWLPALGSQWWGGNDGNTIMQFISPSKSRDEGTQHQQNQVSIYPKRWYRPMDITYRRLFQVVIQWQYSYIRHSF